MKSLPQTFVVATISLCLSAQLVLANTLYYDTSSPHPGWHAENAWSETNDPPVFNTEWVSGSIANFGSGGVTFSTDADPPTIDATPIDVTGMVNSGSAVTFFGIGSAKPGINVLNNGQISGNFNFNTAGLFGSFELTSGKIIGTGSSVHYSTVRTVTVSGTGHLELYFGGRSLLASANTNLLLRDNGLFTADRFSNNTNFGTLTILDNARFDIGSRLGIATETDQTTIRGLSGDATASLTTMTFAQSSSDRTGTKSILRILQDSDTVYAGTINGTGVKTNGPGYNTTQIVKAGTGDLTLSGAISQMQKTTIVEAGRLFINSSTTDFGADDSSLAIEVLTGAALGGTGTIQTAAGKSVLIADGGSLIAGLDGTAGTTNFALGSGASLDLSEAVGNAGWLLFDLGSNSAAGVTYDQIVVSTGQVIIGTEILGFADFGFTVLDGFGAGTFTLLSASAISGTLADASSLTGQINGLDASISLSGDDLILTVIPEPRMLSLFFGSIALCFAVRRWRLR